MLLLVLILLCLIVAILVSIERQMADVSAQLRQYFKSDNPTRYDTDD